MAMVESKVTKMKTFIIEEKFVGYADITIEAETEEEAIQIYKDGIIRIVIIIWMNTSMSMSSIR